MSAEHPIFDTRPDKDAPTLRDLVFNHYNNALGRDARANTNQYFLKLIEKCNPEDAPQTGETWLVSVNKRPVLREYTVVATKTSAIKIREPSSLADGDWYKLCDVEFVERLS